MNILTQIKITKLKSKNVDPDKLYTLGGSVLQELLDGYIPDTSGRVIVYHECVSCGNSDPLDFDRGKLLDA